MPGMVAPPSAAPTAPEIAFMSGDGIEAGGDNAVQVRRLTRPS